MRTYCLPIAVVLACTVLSAGAAPRDEQAAEHTVLVLRNGRVLEGRVTRTGDHYLVTMTDGSIRIRAAEAAFACRDLDEAYALKRSAVAEGDAEAHVALADWCVQHKLFGYAARELVDALRYDPRHPRIALIMRHIEVARQPAVSAASEAAAGAQPRGPSSEELDRMVKALPHGAVEHFSSTVQPLLLHHCSATGCHGPQSKFDLSFWRIPLTQATGRRLTQQNLSAVLDRVSREDPLTSPILTEVVRPHGGVGPIFTTKDAQRYLQLLRWVQYVSAHGRIRGATSPAASSTVATTDSSTQLNPLDAAFQAAATSPFAPSLGADSADPAAPAANEALDAPMPVHGAKQAEEADPFDPAEFNRRYHGDEPQDAEEPSASSDMAP